MSAHWIPYGETLPQALAAEHERAIRDQFRDRRDWRELVEVPLVVEPANPSWIARLWRRLTGGRL